MRDLTLKTLFLNQATRTECLKGDRLAFILSYASSADVRASFVMITR